MKRKIVLMAVLAFLFSAMFVTPLVMSVKAETGTTSTSQSPPLPEEPSLPRWFVDANGTVFQITNSSYLNVTLTSSEPVHVFLESVPRMVSYTMESLSSASSAVLTLSGFVPATTYYRHQEGYLVEQFTTDLSGGYAYTQDISKPHHVYIQEFTSTLYISSDYTFTSNIYEPIVVTANNTVIDGRGYTLQGPGSGYGFYLGRISGVTIKNVKIKGWSSGFNLWMSSGNMISGNNITNNYTGIILTSSRGNTIWSNNITNIYRGVYLYYYSDGNTISSNGIAGNYHYGVYLVISSGNTICGNDITNNYYYGVYLEYSIGNTIWRNDITNSYYWGVALYSGGNIIYHNNFINNKINAADNVYSPQNTWDNGYPSGGNYWSNYVGVDLYKGPNQDQIGSDGIGDTPYKIYAYNKDRYPLINPLLKPAHFLIEPSKGGNAGSVTVSIIGSGFKEGAVVKLRRNGYQDIMGTDTKVPGASQITTTFDLSGREPGIWDLIVTLPDGTEFKVIQAFTIVQGGEPEIWIDISGRDQIRIERTGTYIARVFNTGTIDAEDVFLNITTDPALKVMLVETMDGIVLWNRTTLEENVKFGKQNYPELWVGEQPGLVDKVLNTSVLWIPSIPVGSPTELKVTVYAKSPWTQDDPIHIVALLAWELFGQDFVQHFLSQTIASWYEDGVTLNGIWKALKYATSETVEGLWAKVTWVQKPLEKFIEWSVDGSIADKLSEVGVSWDKAFQIGYDLQGGFMKKGIHLGTLPLLKWSLFGFEVGWEAGEKIDRAAVKNYVPRIERQKPVTPVMSWDPNDKVGPTGFSPKNFIPEIGEIPYTIYFENLGSATASAENIVITDRLDTDLDWTTLSIGAVSHPNVAKVSFDKTTGTIKWTFTGINLPPNKNPPEGEGWVKFTIKPKPNLPSGTEIRNKATIVFDVNPPMDTPEFLITTDYQAPASSVLTLPVQQPTTFEVSWSGTDGGGSGIKDYTIYVSDNSGPYKPWLNRTTTLSATFTGESDHTYAFYSRARDNVGNIEEAPAEPDTATLTQRIQCYLTIQTEPADITTIPGEGWYDATTDVLLEAPATVPISIGIQYRFDHWTVDGNVVSGNPITVHMDADHTATAHYVLQYYLTVTTSPPAVPTPIGEDWYDVSTVVNVNAPTEVTGTAGVRYIFDHWTVDGNIISGNPISVQMDSAHTATAVYTTQYYLTVDSPYDLPGGEGWYNAGDPAYATLQVGLEYVDGLAYGFTGWTVDTQPWGWDLLSEQIVMDAPKTATASWADSAVYGDIRTIGFWKHQVNVWYFTEYQKATGIKLRGIGTAQVTEDALIAYLTFIDTNSDYFKGKIIGATNLDSLRNAYNSLKTPTGTDSMKMRAEQQLLALWLNLAHKAFFWNTQLNQDTLYIYYQYNFEGAWGLATIGEAIKFTEAELLKPDGNYEAAKNVCDSINNNLGIIWGT